MWLRRRFRWGRGRTDVRRGRLLVGGVGESQEVGGEGAGGFGGVADDSVVGVADETGGEVFGGDYGDEAVFEEEAAESGGGLAGADAVGGGGAVGECAGLGEYAGVDRVVGGDVAEFGGGEGLFEEGLGPDSDVGVAAGCVDEEHSALLEVAGEGGDLARGEGGDVRGGEVGELGVRAEGAVIEGEGDDAELGGSGVVQAGFEVFPSEGLGVPIAAVRELGDGPGFASGGSFGIEGFEVVDAFVAEVSPAGDVDEDVADEGELGAFSGDGAEGALPAPGEVAAGEDDAELADAVAHDADGGFEGAYGEVAGEEGVLGADVAEDVLGVEPT